MGNAQQQSTPPPAKVGSTAETPKSTLVATPSGGGSRRITQFLRRHLAVKSKSSNELINEHRQPAKLKKRLNSGSSNSGSRLNADLVAANKRSPAARHSTPNLMHTLIVQPSTELDAGSIPSRLLRKVSPSVFHRQASDAHMQPAAKMIGAIVAGRSVDEPMERPIRTLSAHVRPPPSSASSNSVSNAFSLSPVCQFP